MILLSLRISVVAFLAVLTLGCAGSALAQSATPSASASATPTPSPSATTTPTPSPSATPTSTPSSSPTSSPSSSPTPVPSEKSQVLGAATELGSTGRDLEIAKYVFGGSLLLVGIVFGFKLTRSHAEE